MSVLFAIWVIYIATLVQLIRKKSYNSAQAVGFIAGILLLLISFLAPVKYAESDEELDYGVVELKDKRVLVYMLNGSTYTREVESGNFSIKVLKAGSLFLPIGVLSDQIKIEYE